MTTTKSYSKRTSFFVSSMRRQLSFMVASFILLFIVIVVPNIVDAASYEIPDGEVFIARFYQQVFSAGIYRSEFQAYFVMVILSTLAFAAALSATRHIHRMNMTDLYHSLPIRREKMLITNAATSLIAVLGPFLLIYIGTIAWQMIFFARYGWVGSWYWAFAAMDFLTIAIAVFVIYCFTTLIAVNVGTTFDAMSISAVIGFMPTFIWLIAGAVTESVSHGFSFNAQYVMRVSPFLFFFERVILFSRNLMTGSASYAYVSGELALLFGIWLLVGALFFAGAIFFYRRRRSELAEQTQPHGVLQTVVKCFTALCGSAVFYAIFFDYPLVVHLLVIVLASVVIGIIAELVLSRGVRFILKNIRVLAIAGAVYAILFLGLYFDAFGIVGRVPSTGNIVSVEISYSGRFGGQSTRFHSPAGSVQHQLPGLHHPESIDLVRNVHLAIINDHRRSDRGSSRGGNFLTIEYRLSNGRTLRRRYLNIENETYLMLAALEAEADFIENNFPLFWMDFFEEMFDQLNITANLATVDGLEDVELTLSEFEMSQLIEALQEDILSQPLDSILGGEQALAFLRIQLSTPAARRVGGPAISPWNSDIFPEQGITSFGVTLTQSHSRTLSLLEEYGFGILIRPNPANIYEIRVIDMHGFWHQNLVVTAMPTILRDAEWRLGRTEDADNRMLITNNRAEIASLMRSGRSTLLLSDEARTSHLFMGFYCDEGVLRFGQFVALDDLPGWMHQEMQEHLEWLQRPHDYEHALEGVAI